MGEKRTVRLVVGLRAEDPSAVTALATLKSQMPEECPRKLERYDLWEFELDGGGADTVREIAGRYVDIVNPNKNVHFVLDGESVPPSSQGLDTVWVAVSNVDDSDSLTWSKILRSVGYPLVMVRRSVLWGLCYPSPMRSDLSRARALAVARAVSRSRGLLGNPVSQRIEVLSDAGSPED
ncbi:hypothetical protein GF402_03490 [Candidatus Fermentibacteria bacterium]|nr:hypothetical protein [Candidatus Fermentibacteria bacterium]